MARDNEPVEMELELQYETGKSWWVFGGVGRAVRVNLPKSQVEFPEDAGAGDKVKVEVPRWLAEDKGLV